MRNAGLDEAQAGSKIVSRNINNLRYTDDTILMAKSKEELESLLMKVKEESEEAGLKHSKNEDHGIWSHHFMANRWGNKANSDREISLGSNITIAGDCSHEIKIRLLLGRKAMTNLDIMLKNRDITFLTCPHSQSYSFSSSHVWM